jgi:hypothetical protein
MLKQLKVVPLAMLVAASALTPTVASAQTSDQWQFGAQIYGWFPSLDGKTNFPPHGNSPSVQVDADTILDNLEFVFMGSLEAKRGRWGAFTDVIYMDIGASKSGTRDFSVGGIEIPASASGNLSYDLTGWVWTIAGQYAVVSHPGATADVFLGARLADLEQKVEWGLEGNIGGIPVAGRAGSSTVGRSNWDGVVGVKGRLRFGADNRWFVPYYLDVGTGDSDLTWQAMAGLGYSWQSIDVVGAWRYLDYDFGSGQPFQELTLSGPMLSVVFRC